MYTNDQRLALCLDPSQQVTQESVREQPKISSSGNGDAKAAKAHRRRRNLPNYARLRGNLMNPRVSSRHSITVVESPRDRNHARVVDISFLDQHVERPEGIGCDGNARRSIAEAGY